MSAYFVVQATITDEPKYQKYREAVVPFIASFGGKFAARGANVEVLEGEHDIKGMNSISIITSSRGDGPNSKNQGCGIAVGPASDGLRQH